MIEETLLLIRCDRTIIKILLSGVFLFMLCIRLFNLWDLNLDVTSLLLILLAILPWFLKYVESLEIPGIGTFNISKILSADKHIVSKKILPGELELQFNQKIDQALTLEENQTYISFRARIYYEREAGSAPLLKIQVNETYLSLGHAINKELIRATADGRKSLTFETDSESWRLVYSPTFANNYGHKRYREMNSDPYLFIFNIQEIIGTKENVNVSFIHNGMTGNEAYKNSIIIRDLVAF